MEGLKQPGPLGVIGGRAIQRRLLDYVRGGRMHPSLILSGPDADLKLRIAKNLAKALLCLKPGGRAFCLTCRNCQRIEKDLHPDVIVVKEEDEDTIKIETVRSLCHQMEISPMEAPYKILILQEAHRMNTASANAFLKTLEEPAPGRCFWLLTTSPGSLLPTIQSRCLQFALAPEEEPAGLAAEDSRELDTLLGEALRTRNLSPLVGKLEDRDHCLAFVRHLEAGLRQIAVEGTSPTPAFSGMSRLEALQKFEAAVRLEGRLRSNANCGLLLEDFVRNELLPSESRT